MTAGLKVAGGDRLGKPSSSPGTRITQVHRGAVRRELSTLQSAFARVITFETEYAQSLIDNFSAKEKQPHIAISVDMLDTGIDIPEVCKSRFLQAGPLENQILANGRAGNATCPDLFAPDKHKEFFFVFDYCQNLEFFSQNPETTDGAVGEPLESDFSRPGWNCSANWIASSPNC